MSKRQEANPLRNRLAAFARSITPTTQEQMMVAAILLSLLVGSIVTHCRGEYRVQHPVAASPAPRPALQSPAGE